MIKRFCDICSSEIDGKSWSIKIGYNNDTKRLRRYNDVCCECVGAVLAFAETGNQKHPDENQTRAYPLPRQEATND